MTFKFKQKCSNLPNSKIEPDDDVLIHMNIDIFYPDLMHYDEENDEYFLTRMVPPMPIQYYFSVNGVPRYRVDTDSESASPIKFPGLKIVKDKGESIPWRVNVSPPGSQNRMQIDLGYLDKISCKPRPNIYEPKVFIEPEPKPQWTQENSVFKKYMVDNTKIFEKCFDYDWECSRIPNMIKQPDEQLRVKTLLKKHYRLMRE